MAYSSGKKYSKSGSNDKRSGSSGRFSRSKNNDEKTYKKRDDDDRPRKDSSDRFSRSKSDRKLFKKKDSEERSHRGASDRFSKPKHSDKKDFKKRNKEEHSHHDSSEKSFRSKDGERKHFKKRDREDHSGKSKSFMGKDHPFSKFKKDNSKSWSSSEEKFGDKPKFRRSKRSFESEERSEFSKEKHDHREKKFHDKRHKKFDKHPHSSTPEKEFDGLTRLNKYLSNAGICSRREADDLIKAGAVSVNGKVVTEMGFKVKSTDVINYGGETLRNERKVYILLNKPKDYITTTDDPQERHTVMELIEGACKERVYPVGRLDRNTVGLLLFTNDGELASKLMHPKFGIKKVYHVNLDKKIKPEDFIKLENGIELEDGFIKPDAVEFVGEGKREIGIEIHSGKNRIVRRIFEQLGYEVEKLDRVTYAGLTKKDLGRGKWRFLTSKEIGFLKMIG